MVALKTRIRKYLTEKHCYVASVHIRGDGVIHAKNTFDEPMFSYRLWDFSESDGELFHKGVKVA